MFDQSVDLRGSLRMAEPRELAGPWLVIGVNTRCRVQLTAERVESANGWRVTDVGGCLGGVVPGVVAWRAAPDGMELADADGLTLVFFDANGAGRTPAGAALTLRREAE